MTGSRNLTVKERNCSRCKDKNFLIECACGCKSILMRSNKHGHKRSAIFSHQCLINLTKIKTICRREKHGNWKGGRFYDRLGYVIIKKPDHPFCKKNGYIYEHRIVMEQY